MHHSVTFRCPVEKKEEETLIITIGKVNNFSSTHICAYFTQYYFVYVPVQKDANII